ncbi:GntR family transcriptional regulator [Cupriavidus sp. 30B13]|uniref:GntR family transcriptional regulator n=1 Tax=Cupriavidus sp. 30B13 TaxID=3384241 RepID=UPI003B8FED54
MLVALGVCAFHGARASDIDCQSAPGAGSIRCEDPNGNGMRCSLVTERARNQNLLCGNAQLAGRYERIYAEQQKLLRAGAIGETDVNAWRSKRDACDSTACLESLYHEWWRWRDAGRFKPAQATAAAAAPKPAPVAPAAPVAERAPPARSAAMQESPPPAEPALSATGATDATGAAGTAPAQTTTAPAEPGPAAGTVVLPALLTGFATVGMGTAWLWRRRRGRPGPAGPARRPAVSAAMAIFYGLLIVNALLLPFTLGWS